MDGVGFQDGKILETLLETELKSKFDRVYIVEAKTDKPAGLKQLITDQSKRFCWL